MNDTDFFDETLMVLFAFILTLAFVDYIVAGCSASPDGLANRHPVIVRTVVVPLG